MTDYIGNQLFFEDLEETPPTEEKPDQLDEDIDEALEEAERLSNIKGRL